jgi:hypothetical protein
MEFCRDGFQGGMIMALAEETPLFTVKRVSLDQPGVGKQPIEMPVDVLLGLPAYVISQEQLFLAAFNLPKRFG